jgi:hypothetical protein
MDATRLAGFVPELRIPGIAVVVGTSLIGASAGSLGGPFPAAIFGAVGFAWGVLCVLIAARLIRSPRRATFGKRGAIRRHVCHRMSRSELYQIGHGRCHSAVAARRRVCFLQSWHVRLS